MNNDVYGKTEESNGSPEKHSSVPSTSDPLTDSFRSMLSDDSSDDDVIVAEETTPTQTTQEGNGTEGGWLESASEKLKRAGNMFSSLRPTKSSTSLKEKMWSTWNNVKYSGKWMMSHRSSDYSHASSSIVLFGQFYAPDRNLSISGGGFTDFVYDYYSKIWMTYRTNMEPMAGTPTISDCGWGCMIRTTQMMTAHAISLNRIGRCWRFRRSNTDSESYSSALSNMTHLEIIRLFEDCPSAPLGIHKMMELSSEREGSEAVGRWYAPSEAVSLMRRALSSSPSPLTSDLSILLSVDGVIRVSDAERISQNWTKRLLLVVTLRLGTTEVNTVYYPHLQYLFASRFCLGIVGGRPDHSLYFVGNYGEQVIYLDPHVAHEYVPLPSRLADEEEEAEPSVGKGAKPDGIVKKSGKKPRHPLHSFHCKLMSKMPFSEMDPSCAVGFLLESREHFEKAFHELNLSQVIDIELGEGLGHKRTRDPLFVVLYNDDVITSPVPFSSENTEQDRKTASEHGFELL